MPDPAETFSHGKLTCNMVHRYTSHEGWLRLKSWRREHLMSETGQTGSHSEQEPNSDKASFESDRKEPEKERKEQAQASFKKEQSDAQWKRIGGYLMIGAIVLFIGMCVINDRNQHPCPDDPGACYDFQMGRE
jgi:hypothetical protein